VRLSNRATDRFRRGIALPIFSDEEMWHCQTGFDIEEFSQLAHFHSRDSF
jgi:hypothetical protein